MNDKTLLKIAGIIGIILGIVNCIFIIGLLWGIPMIIGGYKFYQISQLNDNEIIKYQSTILGWSIFFIIFSLIPGILGLVYYFGITEAFKTNPKNNYTTDLENLKKLYEDKTITKEEYETKKKEILDRI